jgi:NADPH oxidase
MSFLLIPVLKNFISFIRTTPAADKLPLDDNIQIHKWTAYFIAFSALCHISFHFADFWWFQYYQAIPIAQNIASLPGITGLLLVLMMLVMYSTALLKRKTYNIFGHRFDGYRTFLYLHRLWMPVYFVMWFHGSQTWQFTVFPLMFLLLEKYIQR